MKPQFLFIMLGYPGSGKTTASKAIHELTGAVHLWADHERHKLFKNPTHLHAENLKLYAILNKRTDRMLADGKSVIFDTNFNFYKDRQKMRRIAAKYGAKAMLVWVRTPKEVARYRATEGAHLQNTRILGDMPVEQFERITGNLQLPRDDEPYITVDGTKITPEYIKSLLPAEMLT